MSEVGASAGGLPPLIDPTVDYVLAELLARSNTALAAELPVEGFAGFANIAFSLAMTSLTFTGGTTPTAQLKAWVQRETADDQWDDLLAFQSGAMPLSGAGSPNAAPVYLQGDYLRSLGPALAPAGIQDCGTPPFAQRSAWLSNRVRIKHQLVLAGAPAPSAAVLIWSLLARGRP